MVWITSYDGPDQSYIGKSYTVGVGVSPTIGSGVPTGSVVFDDSDGQTCTIDLFSDPKACSLTSTSVGPKTLTAYLSGSPITFTPVSQRQVFSFEDLGIPIDNIEGMTFGPILPDGRQALVIVSDNNFSPGQFTQFILLALEIEPVE